MKKVLLSLLIFAGSYAFGQTIFSEDFEGTAQGDLPQGWTEYNLDGGNPQNGAYAQYFNGKAWVVVTGSSTNNNALCGTSWYSPNVQANDWVVTPSISIPAAGSYVLQFQDNAPDPAYPDDYEVWVSTSGATPTDFQNNGTKVYESVPTGNWITHTVDLSSYSGQNIYIAFRNIAYDENLVFIDNVKVLAPLDDDLELEAIEVDKTMIGNRTFTIKVVNNGANTVSAFDLDYTFDGQSHSENITGVSLSVGGSYSFTFNANIPNEGSKTVTATLNYNDEDMSNNSKTASFNFLPSIIQYAQTDINGNPFDLYSSLSKGQAIILDFMASWCQPCLQSTPALSQLVENNGSGNGPLQALAISVEQTDNTSVMQGLDWNGGYYEYPKFAYSSANNNNYYHYSVNHGLNEGYIPFFVMICPDVDNPAASDIVVSDVGYGAGMFNAYQAALDACPTATYLDVIEFEEDFTFKTYPNPASTFTNVEFNLASEKDVTISILNTVGQTVVNQDLGKVSGAQSVQLDVSALESGMYIVKVKSGNTEKTQMISVM